VPFTAAALGANWLRRYITERLHTVATYSEDGVKYSVDVTSSEFRKYTGGSVKDVKRHRTALHPLAATRLLEIDAPAKLADPVVHSDAEGKIKKDRGKSGDIIRCIAAHIKLECGDLTTAASQLHARRLVPRYAREEYPDLRKTDLAALMPMILLAAKTPSGGEILAKQIEASPLYVARREMLGKGPEL
jgi:hypothetical protein